MLTVHHCRMRPNSFNIIWRPMIDYFNHCTADRVCQTIRVRQGCIFWKGCRENVRVRVSYVCTYYDTTHAPDISRLLCRLSILPRRSISACLIWCWNSRPCCRADIQASSTSATVPSSRDHNNWKRAVWSAPTKSRGWSTPKVTAKFLHTAADASKNVVYCHNSG